MGAERTNDQMDNNTRTFPKNSYCGVATSSYQIGGPWNGDGTGLSIWDTYTHTPGHIKNNDTGDVAEDGRVYDSERVMFPRAYLTRRQRAGQ